ncbi:MAG: phosphoribosyltransferase [Pararhizobium sp.]
MPFVDRRDAGRRLAAALGALKGEEAVVLAMPRGGVPVAAEIARSLGAPLDVTLVRKIGVPSHPELAMGAVVDGGDPVVVRNDDVIRAARIAARDFDDVCRRELAEIERRRQRYRGAVPPAEVAGRTVVLVDDGIATGATMRAALRGLRQRRPKRIVVAIPLAPHEAVAELRGEADVVVCLEEPAFFEAIGCHYEDFRQLNDDDVVSILGAVRSETGRPEGRPFSP